MLNDSMFTFEIYNLTRFYILVGCIFSLRASSYFHGITIVCVYPRILGCLKNT